MSPARAAKPSRVAVMAAELEKLESLAPRKFAAFEVLIEMAVRQETAKKHAARGLRGQLLARLQRIHDCPQPLGGQFEQLPRTPGQSRRWRCSGCDTIIGLD